MTGTTAPKKAKTPTTIATVEDNAALEHSETGATTRDDQTDAGVKMVPTEHPETVGPEDALGEGAKRGDYRERVPGDPHEVVPAEGGGQPIYKWVDAAGAEVEEGTEGATRIVVDYTPSAVLQSQSKRTDDIGDEPGKGGVSTAS